MTPDNPKDNGCRPLACEMTESQRLAHESQLTLTEAAVANQHALEKRGRAVETVIAGLLGRAQGVSAPEREPPKSVGATPTAQGIREQAEHIEALMLLPFLTAEQAAYVVQVHVVVIRRACASRKLRAVRVNRGWRIRPQALFEWMNEPGSHQGEHRR
jgi:excisionase family DNA binding protein